MNKFKNKIFLFRVKIIHQKKISNYLNKGSQGLKEIKEEKLVFNLLIQIIKIYMNNINKLNLVVQQ